MRERPFVGRTLRHLGVALADVDDLTQETFLIANRYHREQGGTLPGRPWLFAAARRVAANHRRTIRRRATRLELIAKQPRTNAAGCDGYDAALVLSGFLDRIKEDLAIAFVLFEIEGFSGVEVGQALGISPNTAFGRLRGARRELTRLLASLPEASEPEDAP